MPFGVELPDNIGQPPVDTGSPGGGAPAGAAPSGAPAGAAPAGAPNQNFSPGQSGTQPTTQQLLELDKHERFRFKGREYTQKEWEDGHLRQQDYSKKTAELTEQRKYVDNFSADLERVWTNPDKWLSQFERVYPPNYVALAKTILAKRQAATSQPAEANESQTPSIKDDPEFQELKSEISEWKKAQQEAQVEASRSWLKSQHDVLGKKYPYAHPEVVESRVGAWAMRNGGNRVDAKVMDQFYQQANDEQKKRSDELYRTKVTKQINTGKEGRDIGAGGDAPGGAPRKFKTIQEATKGMLADIEASRAR